MGIRFYCPNGHKLNVKEFQAGQRGICPKCHAKFDIPFESTRPAGSKDLPLAKEWEERARREGLYPFTKKTEPDLENINLNQLPAEDWNTVPNSSDAIGFTAEPSNSGVLDTFNSSGIFSQPAAPEPAAPKLPDPFEGPADIVWYVRPSSGEQLGPVNGDTVKTWLAEKRITADTLVWREGWADWKTASDVFESLAGAKNMFGF